MLLGIAILIIGYLLIHMFLIFIQTSNNFYFVLLIFFLLYTCVIFCHMHINNNLLYSL